MGIASVSLVDLQVSGTTVGENWQKAVNTLVTSLKKNRVCLVNLPAEAASNIIATSTACDKFFDEDTSLKREYSYIGTRELGYRQEHSREVYELPVPMHPGLRTPACLSPWTEQAFTVLDRTARVLLQSLSMSHELELSPYALFPLLDFAPCPTAKMSASSLEISRHFKSGAGLTAVEEDEAGALQQGEDPGILTLVSAWEQGLQVQTAKGVWLDVPLSPNQVAVMSGYTLWHATAGLLEPSVHRMVFRSRRDSMAITYRLAARPTAVIDTPHIMAESGHPIPDRFRHPLSVKELMANFQLGRTTHATFLYSRTSAAGLTTRTPSPVVSRPGPRPGSDTSLPADQLEPLDADTPPAVPTPAKPTLRDRTRMATALAALSDDPLPPAIPAPTPSRNPFSTPSSSGSSHCDPTATYTTDPASSAMAPTTAHTVAATTASSLATCTGTSATTATTATSARAAPTAATATGTSALARRTPTPPLRSASPADRSAGPLGSAPRRTTPSPFRSRLRSTASADSPTAARATSTRPAFSSGAPNAPHATPLARPRTAPATRDGPSVMTGARSRPRLTDSETKVRSEDLHHPTTSASTRRPPSYLQPTMSTAIRHASKSASPSPSRTPPPARHAATAGSNGNSPANDVAPRKPSWSASTRSPTAAAAAGR